MSTITSILLLCQALVRANDPFLATAKAIMAVESGGDCEAYNPAEDALGPFQIRPGYLWDVNRFRKAQGLPAYHRRDCKDPVKALDMVREYTIHYARHYGRPWTAETIARIHNGGPVGWKKAGTVRYWRKVQAEMKRDRPRG